MAAEPPAKLDYKSRCLVSQIVEHVKSQGIFDQFRRDCIDELEQKESYRQLKQRVESHVATFLSKQTWTDVLPKNQVRDSLRKHINQSEVLDRGVKQLISQALESKAKAFQTHIEGVVQNYIYTQKHPQNQDKSTRKHRTVDSKEDTKPLTSEVISDISQLIPVPCSSGTGSKTTESFSSERGKPSPQEGSKSVPTAKGAQQMKKSHSTQVKTSVHAGKGEETKTGSPFREKDQTEESGRTKDGKLKASRVKAESLSRDDHSQMSPRPEESLHKVKDEKTKISRVKLENSFSSEGFFSLAAADSSSLNSQDEMISSLKGVRENLVQSQLSPAEDTGVSQGDVTRLSQIKIEKANESDSYVCSSSEYKVKVKEERSTKTFGVKVQTESSENAAIQWKQEELVDSEQKSVQGDSENEHGKNLFSDGMGRTDSGAERSDDFVMTTMVDEMGERVAQRPDGDVVVIVDESKVKELEKSGRVESLKQTETAIKLERKEDGKREEKKDLGTETSLKVRSAVSSDLSSGKSIDLPAAKSGEDLSLSSHEEDGVREVPSLTDGTQRKKEDERGLPSGQKESTARAESFSEKTGLEASSLTRENVDHASSTGEYSDGESEISEVSSVHTSDLSSFDDEISSLSESYDENDEDEAYEHDEKDNQERSSAQPQNEQDCDSAPRRRSTRISSRRSTKEGESELSESECRKIQTDSARKRRHDERRERKPRIESAKGQSESGREKRRRGRPRKDEKRGPSCSGRQMRRSRTRDQDDSSTAAERSGSGSREDRRKRSQRQVKRTRCYSPSSEGTREVFLPRKRSRDDPS